MSSEWVLFLQVMVLEYLAGGEMLHHLHKVAHYSEAEAARLFAQVGLDLRGALGLRAKKP